MNKKGKKNKEESLSKIAQKAEIHPMLPTKYNVYERAQLRKFEQELLNYETGKDDKPNKVKSKNNVKDEDIER